MKLDYIEGAGPVVRVGIINPDPEGADAEETLNAAEEFARDMCPEAGALTDVRWTLTNASVDIHVVLTFERDL